MKTAIILFNFLFFHDVFAFEKTFTAGSLNKISVTNTKGPTLITSTRETTVKVSIEKIKFEEKCSMNAQLTGQTLEVEVASQNKLFNTAHCEARVKIEVPEKSLYEFDLSSGTGDQRIEKISGHFDLQTATGAIDIEAESLKNLAIKSASGPVRATFRACQGRGDVSVLSAASDVTLTLPETCKIRVSHKSATGDLFNELGESADYQVMISSKSASGKLMIKKRAR